MDNRPIGVFDSGYGGITSVKALLKLLPDENIVFFGDNGRAPYGTRSEAELRHFVKQNIAFLDKFNIKALVVSCGTASSVGREIIENVDYPSTGVIAPAVEKLVRLGTGGKPVGIIATGACVSNGLYEKIIGERLPGTKTVSVACTDFVPLVESGRCSKDDPAVADACRRYLEPIKAAGAGSIILGCTHYGLLSDAIADYLGTEVVQIEASACAAESMAEYLSENGMLGSGGRREYFTSGSTADFNRNATVFLEGTDTVNSKYASADV